MSVVNNKQEAATDRSIDNVRLDSKNSDKTKQKKTDRT